MNSFHGYLQIFKYSSDAVSLSGVSVQEKITLSSTRNLAFYPIRYQIPSDPSTAKITTSSVIATEPIDLQYVHAYLACFTSMEASSLVLISTDYVMMTTPARGSIAAHYHQLTPMDLNRTFTKPTSESSSSIKIAKWSHKWDLLLMICVATALNASTLLHLSSVHLAAMDVTVECCVGVI